ncbi:MAG: hypothetical protein M1546_26745, partial [Chloroflexi bacterium]|nr:hypothetical protein [Chloroflexota bacterium]
MRTRFARITKRLARLWWCSIAATAFAVLVIAMAAGPAQAVAYSYVYYGMDSSVDCSDWTGDAHHISGWASCWHNDESSTDFFGNSAFYTAVDYTKSGGGTAGTLVQLWYNGANIRPQFRNVFSTQCTGVRVDTFNGVGTYLGDIHYKHIDVYSGVIGSS